MARTHGRIMAAIWSDDDFIAMRGSAQRMFMFLLSQPDLSHAGLIPMRVNRWAKKAEDLTPRLVREELDYLAAQDFVIVDEDTEEVLIRTFVRNDGVYKQPKVMIRLREDAKQIESPMLRSAFKAELERLPLDELSTKAGGPHGDQPSTREQVERVVNTLRGDFADVEIYPRERVSETPPDTPHVRAGAFHLPPTTIPLPPTTGHGKDSCASANAERDTDPRDSDFDAWYDAYPRKRGRGQALKAYRAARKKVGADVLLEAIRQQSAALVANGAEYVPYPATWLNGERWADRPDSAIPPPLSNTQQHLALARQLAEEEQPTMLEIGQGR